MNVKVASEVVRTSKYVVIEHVAVLGLKAFVVFRNCGGSRVDPGGDFHIPHDEPIRFQAGKSEIGFGRWAAFLKAS